MNNNNSDKKIKNKNVISLSAMIMMSRQNGNSKNFQSRRNGSRRNGNRRNGSDSKSLGEIKLCHFANDEFVMPVFS